MDTKRYCVYNKTTASFLSVGASVVDAELEPVKAHQMMVDVENLTPELSFWLKPFKAVPVARIVCPFDMVFLTEELRVVQALELSPAVELPPIEDQVASALVLPLHTAYSSRTYPGDQLIICAAEELVRHLAHVPGSARSAPVLHSPKPYPEEPRSPRPVLVSAPPEKRQTWAEPQGIQATAVEEKIDGSGADKKRRLEFQAEEIDAVISQVRSWAGELPRPKAPVSIAPPQPSTRKNIEFAAKEADSDGGLQPRLPEDLPRRKPATQRLEEREKVETHARVSRESVDFNTQDVESVVSQVLRWAEETGRPIARAPIAATPPAPAATSAAPTIGQPRAESGLARPLSVDGPGRQETAVQPVEEEEKPEEHSKGSWISRFLRWAGELAHLLLGMAAKPSGDRSSSSTPSPAEEASGHRNSIRSSLSVHVKRLEVATDQLNAKANARTVAQHMHSLRTRFVRWLDADSLTTVVSAPGDRRRSKRHPLPGLVAYYWTGGTPQAHQIGDISSTGFYLLTKERWVPDTLIRMTLQRPGPKGEKAEEAISVVSRVVRWGENGVGYEFVASKVLEMSGEPVDRPNEARQRLY